MRLKQGLSLYPTFSYVLSSQIKSNQIELFLLYFLFINHFYTFLFSPFLLSSLQPRKVELDYFYTRLYHPFTHQACTTWCTHSNFQKSFTFPLKLLNLQPLGEKTNLKWQELNTIWWLFIKKAIERTSLQVDETIDAGSSLEILDSNHNKSMFGIFINNLNY